MIRITVFVYLVTAVNFFGNPNFEYDLLTSISFKAKVYFFIAYC